jgi:hypothetical protein
MYFGFFSQVLRKFNRVDKVSFFSSAHLCHVIDMKFSIPYLALKVSPSIANPARKVLPTKGLVKDRSLFPRLAMIGS